MSSTLGDSPTLPGFTTSEMKAMQITSAFENGISPGGHHISFGGLTGNIDGMGLSFGLMQWNVGSGSLLDLLRDFEDQHPYGFAKAFGNDASRLHELLHPPQHLSSRELLERRMDFARSINDAHHNIVPQWAGHFNALAQDPAFQQIELSHVRHAMDRAEHYMQHFSLHSERALALLFDVVTQHGPGWLSAHRQELIRQEVTHALQHGSGQGEHTILKAIGDVTAQTSKVEWRDDVQHRRDTIVNGSGLVHQHHFNLATEFGLTDQMIDHENEETGLHLNGGPVQDVEVQHGNGSVDVVGQAHYDGTMLDAHGFASQSEEIASIPYGMMLDEHGQVDTVQGFASQQDGTILDEHGRMSDVHSHPPNHQGEASAQHHNAAEPNLDGHVVGDSLDAHGSHADTLILDHDHLGVDAGVVNPDV